jgi:hypothetical protein
MYHKLNKQQNKTNSTMYTTTSIIHHLLFVAVVVITSSTSATAFQSSFVCRGGSTITTASTKTFIPRNSKSTLFMKTIAVFGSSGLTASECVYQGIQNGDTVVGLTRYVVLQYVWLCVGI